MKTQPTVPVHKWLSDPLAPDVNMSIERISAAADVVHVAVMPDVHLSHDVCVGLAVATRNLVYPQAIGSDIGCGMAAVAFDSTAELLTNARSAAQLLRALYETIPIIRHRRRRTADSIPGELAVIALSSQCFDRRTAEVEFATLGRGNHFLEFQADDEDRLWLMLHSGSRGIGQAIRLHHTDYARPASTQLIGLHSGQPAGEAYLHDLKWARQYARESRLAMLRAVAALVLRLFNVAADERSVIECDHNHVQRERHFDQELWIHRKGATFAGDGAPGIIPGSMGTCSFHTIGRGVPEALCSSSHGAGRALSRSDARRAINPSSVIRQMRGIWFDKRLAAPLREEAPSAYKDINRVMRAQRDLTRILRQLRPVLVYKGA